jgi:hypothetical protein
MTFIRIRQIVLKAGGILLLGSILFLFEQIPFDVILYGSEPLPSTVAPFRYKIPPPPPPSTKELSPTGPDVQSQPEQQAVSTENSPHVDPAVLEQPTTMVDPSADKVEPAQSDAGDKQKKEKKSAMAVSKTATKTASGSIAGTHLKSEPLSPKDSVNTSSFKKILEIVSDLSSPSAEMITIFLTGQYPPQTQVIEGKTPKIICDFPDVLMDKTIKRMIPINGKYILQVRTGIHPPPEPKSRVVIDLVPDHDYEVEQLFYEKNNRYSMIIREKP